MPGQITATAEQLSAAFEEWDRRYREDPCSFMNDVEHLLGETPETYGEACAPYFTSLLQDQGATITKEKDR